MGFPVHSLYPMNKRILELDALRGMAALMVVVFHLLSFSKHDTRISNLGTTGVDLFFIISGFVILMTLERCKSWKDFLFGRFSRLYPAYWFCVTATSVLIFLSIVWGMKSPYYNISFTQYLANMTMFQYWLKSRNIDGPYWTLTVELVFYLYMLTLLLFNQVKRIEVVSFPIVLLSLACAIFKQQIESNNLLRLFTASIPLLGYFPLFYTGILIYRIKQGEKALLRWCVIVACLGIQVLLFKGYHHTASILPAGDYAGMLLFFLCIFFLYTYDKLGVIINKASLFYGRISYSLYLIHQFFCVGLLQPILTEKLHLNYWVSFVLTLATVTLVAYFINTKVEQKSLSYLRSKRPK
jgi:peptidoglycan/LPS O-acetylase OafA/YrhL